MTALSRIPRPRVPALTPNVLLVGIIVTGLIGILALGLSASVNAKQVEDRATSKATTQSLCSLIGLFLPKAGDPPNTTERGRLVVSRFEAEYERLRCAELTKGPSPTISPR